MREDLQRLLIGEEEFLEITGVSYTEIKYGFNYFVIEPDLAQSYLKDVNVTDNFDNALATVYNELKKKTNTSIFRNLQSLFFTVLFCVLFLVIPLQIILWLIDLIFKTELLSMKIIFTYFPLYYSVILLGIWMGIEMVKSSAKTEIETSRRTLERLESLKKLRKLFLECENYNKIIKSIHVKDQIGEVLENKKDETRQELLQGLQKIKNNLIKALKLERIMRENADVVGVNRESLEITFAELEYSNMTDNASQYSEFVDDILELRINLNKEFEEFKL